MKLQFFRISALLMSVLFISLWLAAGVRAAGPAFVQSATNSISGAPTSIAVSFSKNTASGDVILVAIDFNWNVGATAVTDSQGNVFTYAGNRLTAPDNVMHSRVFYATNIKGGADTITVPMSGSTTFLAINVAEYSGVNPTNPIDVQVASSGGAGTISSGSATTTASGDLIYGFCASEGSCSAGAGFTVGANLSSSLIENELAGSAGSYAATGTATGGWMMQMVALRAASGGAGGTPAITSATTASGTVAGAFSYQITATNTPTSYGATGLPAGLAVNGTTGLISGTPTAAGTSTVTLSATNSGGTGNASLTLTISAAAPVITSSTTASGTVGSAFSYQITATNSPTSYGATGLPAGLSVSGTTGLISGTPTTAGTSTVTVSATNSKATGNASLTLTISAAAAAPVITSSTTASGTVGSAFSYQITATNSPTSYGATGLPAGLSVSGTTGLISGTPTAAGTSTVTLSATNSTGTGKASLSLTVSAAAPVITSSTTANGTVGSAFSYQITATNTPTTYGATGLPAGLSVAGTTGMISGMPTTPGTSTVTVSATNSKGTGSASVAVTLATVPANGQLMSLSSNRKYLVNTITGQPVFVVGDDAYNLPQMLTSAEMTQYFQTRSQQGFNAVWLAAVDNTYTANPPKNAAGQTPFDGAVFTDFDSGYWASLDAAIQQASSYGITVFLNPFFVANSYEQPAGYYSSLLSASAATLQGYATFLGNRYKGYNNIVWLLGGDSRPSDSGVYSQLNIFGTALFAADPNHLITLEACEQCVTNGYNSVSGFQAAGIAVPTWLTLNWAYPQYTTTVGAAYSAFTASPFLPPIAGENFYELENSMTEPGLRFEMYSEILSGAYVGRIFGNGAIWSFNSPNGSSCVNGDNSCRSGSPTWQTELTSPGALAQEYQGLLFRSREHWLLVPDASHTVVTAGYGSGQTVTTTARTSDGQTIISYIPNGNATTITVNMAEITSPTSTVQAWWYDPSNGATTNLGTLPNSGTHQFTPPDSNDWVLVLDNAEAGLPAPGTN